jgi:alkaline phosphatase D
MMHGQLGVFSNGSLGATWLHLSLAVEHAPMTMSLRLLLLCTLALAASAAGSTTIAFGSCCKHQKPQPIWGGVLLHKPDLFVWTGDAVYADTTNMAKMAQHYAKQQAVPTYAALTKSTPIDGTWDDHDYGENNAGKDYPKKADAQQLYLDFIGIPTEHPRRQREGVWGKRVLGKGDQQVKLLFLDCRYHRDRPRTQGGTVLGAAQWAWLEQELAAKDTAITILVSGIQIVASDHKYEKWANFPAERQRLMDIISSTGATGVIAVSGDRHISEISVEKDGVPYPLYDLTASALTNTWINFPGEPNSRRVGEPYSADNNAGLIVIDWAAQTLTLRIIDTIGATGLEQVIPLAELR